MFDGKNIWCRLNSPLRNLKVNPLMFQITPAAAHWSRHCYLLRPRQDTRRRGKHSWVCWHADCDWMDATKNILILQICTCMCVYIYTRIYNHIYTIIYIYSHTYIYIYNHIYNQNHTYIYIYRIIYIYIIRNIYIWSYIYIWSCIYIYVMCIYIYMYTYMYTYMYDHVCMFFESDMQYRWYYYTSPQQYSHCWSSISFWE